MWEPISEQQQHQPHQQHHHNRGLSPIPEFDYYNADDEDSSSNSSQSSTAKLLASLSNHDLAFEWSMLCQDCTDCWSGNGKKTDILYCAKISKKCKINYLKIKMKIISKVDSNRNEMKNGN